MLISCSFEAAEDWTLEQASHWPVGHIGSDVGAVVDLDASVVVGPLEFAVHWAGN